MSALRASCAMLQGPQAHKDLRTRVTEHNILVISGYYARLRMERLSQLLDLSLEQASFCEQQMWAAHHRLMMHLHASGSEE